MVFSSTVFLFVFLPFVCIFYFLVPKNLKNLFLLLCSLVFIAWGSIDSLIIMLISISSNYFAGIGIGFFKDKPKQKKLILALGVMSNLGLLMYYKYSNLIVYKFMDLTGIKFIWNDVALPIGISFFIFQGMSYVIDVYRADANVQHKPLDLALYIALFPQLIAGPIVRYVDIEYQLTKREESLDKFAGGLQTFIVGLSKKMLLANTLGSIADKIFNNMEYQSAGVAWLGVLCYALQIYYDFSGYSDMAIGLGSLFGFKFLQNFNYPYISQNLSEFWRRWHITLSTWFRDYLYIPLGGNRRGNVYVNLFIVFICTGIWHGASGRFLLWGLWHGVFLAIEHAYRKKKNIKKSDKKPFNPLAWLYTILVVLLGWVLFRADTLDAAITYYKTMFGINVPPIARFSVFYYLNAYTILLIVIGILVALRLPQTFYYKIANKNENLSIVFASYIKPFALLFLFVVCIVYLVNGTFNPFIYFRF